MLVSAPKSHKINKLNNSEPQKKRRGLIYILIAILFLVYMKVNFAAILDFFFQIRRKKISNKNLAETMSCAFMTFMSDLL